MSKNIGGPAFPLSVGDQECCGRFESGYGGMSLRDYFAAKAMHAIITEPFVEGEQGFLMYFKKRLGLEGEGLDAYAQVSYAMADAMLKAREANYDNR